MTTTIASFYRGLVRVALEWKLADLWIGAFWKRGEYELDIWVCLLPCLPIHITIFSGESPFVCPGCYAVGGERCAPGCIDAEIEAEGERERAFGAIGDACLDCDEVACSCVDFGDEGDDR
jgi:hypothetical protein